MDGAAMTEVPNPGVIMEWLETQAKEIDTLGKRLEAGHIALGEAEAEWEGALDIGLLELLEKYSRKGERLPAEDVRLALVRKECGFEVYARYRRAKHLVEGIEKHSRKLETAISARQSTLKGLQEEMKLPSVDPRTGEIRGR
jgi:hypothetical protein